MDINKAYKETDFIGENSNEIKNIDRLEVKLSEQREEWGNLLIKLFSDMKNIKNLPEVQVQILSNRHYVTDEISQLTSKLNILKESYNIKKRQLFTEIDSKIQENSFIPWNEKSLMIEGNVASKTRQISMIENQINFFKEIIKTLDNSFWSINNTIKFKEVYGN